MSKSKALGLGKLGLIPATLLVLGINIPTVFAQENKQANIIDNLI